jgi:hypothetical protein
VKPKAFGHYILVMIISFVSFTTPPFQARCSRTKTSEDLEPIQIGGKSETTLPASLADLVSSFTLLFQDASGGLEFGDRKTGEFIPATPQEGIVYMNIGDMFQRISNGKFPVIQRQSIIPISHSY